MHLVNCQILSFPLVYKFLQILFILCSIFGVNKHPKYGKLYREQPPVQLWIFQCKVFQHGKDIISLICRNLAFLPAEKFPTCDFMIRQNHCQQESFYSVVFWGKKRKLTSVKVKPKKYEMLNRAIHQQYWNEASDILHIAQSQGS